MKILNIKQEYNHIKLMRERHIEGLLSKIKERGGLGNETEIELNIEGCVTDYPPTPLFIDYFLDHLANQDGEKKLIVKLDSFDREILVLHILVLEGIFFGIYDKINTDVEIGEWKDIINKKLKENKIILEVRIPNHAGYVYGN